MASAHRLFMEVSLFILRFRVICTSPLFTKWEPEGVIKEVLKNGLIKGDSGGRNLVVMNRLIDANILALINQNYMFHSRIVERACEQLYGKELGTFWGLFLK
jgi:hypothetical protein